MIGRHPVQVFLLASRIGSRYPRSPDKEKLYGCICMTQLFELSFDFIFGNTDRLICIVYKQCA